MQAKNLISKFECREAFVKNLQRFNLFYKKTFRNLFGAFYFKLRYLNLTNIETNGQVYKHSLDYYINNTNSLFFTESKMQELFEYSDKAKFLSASLLSIDISEINTIDSFKENYPYTVLLLNPGAICKIPKDPFTEGIISLR
jgi:hypothetical protein